MSTPFYDLASLVVVPSGYKASKVYAQKPQTTDGQLAFTRASTATRVNASGLVASVATGVPRLDYLNSSCPKLLLEPQRSNLCPFSEQFNNAAWLTVEATITPNAIAAPDGTISADLILDNAVSDQHAVYEGISSGAGVHTWSVFAKAQNLNFIIVNAFGGSDNRTWFNLSNGTIGTNAAGNTATITNYGNGWYRCTVTRSYASGTFLFVAATAPSNGVFSYVGSGNGLYLWGAQVELGAYATSYIPTTTAAVTRGEDICNKTSITSLIGQTEGTLYGEFYWDGNPIENWIASVQTSVSNFIAMFLLDDGRPYFYILNSGSVQMAYIGTALSVGYHKMAFGYAANNSVAYVNGVLINTDTSCTIPATSEFRTGSVVSSHTQTAKIKQALLFKTRLTNAQLAELTTI